MVLREEAGKAFQEDLGEQGSGMLEKRKLWREG